MKRLVSFLSAITLSAAPVVAGPFGFDTSSKTNPADIYSYCERSSDSPYGVSCTSAPKPHPDIDMYYISFVKGIGVCSIGAGVFSIDDNTRGTFTKFKTDEIANQVKTKYGNWTEKTDWISSASIWDEYGDWMMSLKTKDRYY